MASRSDFDEDAARETAREEVAADGYEGVGQPYGCIEDCGGHEAGFAYAADHPDFAGGGESQSFDEGAQAFEEAVDEKVEEARDAYEDDGKEG